MGWFTTREVAVNRLASRPQHVYRWWFREGLHCWKFGAFSTEGGVEKHEEIISCREREIGRQKYREMRIGQTLYTKSKS
jgi:hypothetical protein